MREVRPRRLEGRGIVRAYDERVVVDHVDLVVDPGRITVVIGPNGAGKTTLFNCLAGSEFPDGGQVVLGDVDVTHMDSDNRARLGLARTFQQSTVFGSLTVEENLWVGAENRRHDGTFRGLFGVADRSSAAARATVGDVLSALALRPLRNAKADSLPTGTLRMIEVGRALCMNPSVLLLDEPASGLDDAETEELHQLMHRLAGRGLGLLMIEHDLDLVRDAADVVYVMVSGRVFAVGRPEDVISRPDVRSAALGLPV